MSAEYTVVTVDGRRIKGTLVTNNDKGMSINTEVAGVVWVPRPTIDSVLLNGWRVEEFHPCTERGEHVQTQRHARIDCPVGEAHTTRIPVPSDLKVYNDTLSGDEVQALLAALAGNGEAVKARIRRLTKEGRVDLIESCLDVIDDVREIQREKGERSS